ncbi:mannose-1-phosphate guanylyltransferase/mannose-6-phosphate isomerase [Yersinia enterocolitica]|uniref:mannose-1-phosphate guanylyltransferase/mannose-6-phosphate isomerase n=1 Tax=Yersinia enterocolitica TaxID=630 RepID=UPI0021E8A8FE|nr:mannose-1-phosphate guanylyltransferase/mannose-6-phosphate isomerase [Yersinia enterocolitica]EKN3948942.1 mannose-1-phosphate guanylyltransferase/mannose-6-phosphate isomerase [Yersinia enterocolitica]EKN3982750.1 mannose-1-phosphate guanylyltransferase/mannose-6-phosphate isomerase [Yersinia enterocolitica]EKN3987188.1 mannose-1-phosphate guanylyltransferase/mannose-6-phosphate isomerase [Yersinia enterocolitica]EKN5943935.1 mannose-1-phosphate guanylyltransferase/mannose-6-phosphate isom
MTNKILPIIMAGGSGSRLWPLSRSLYPKQFLSLISTSTMLQETVDRLNNIEHSPPVFICNEEHRFVVAEQLRNKSISHSGILLEPEGRNTAPAIAIAALKAINDGVDPLLLVLAADHLIEDVDEFEKSISNAIPYAKKNKLVTFGIVPTNPESGYGYIREGAKIGELAYEVKEFIEKPSVDRAIKYLNSGEYYWNSGIFLFKASVYLSELKKYRSDIYESCVKAVSGIHIDLDFIRLDEAEFLKCPNESIDYAVMENSKDTIVVSMDARWNDIGSWAALWRVTDKDINGNAVRGDVLVDTSENSYIYSQSRLVTVVGVSNLVIVETKDAVLVVDKDKTQNVKNIVERLKENNRTEYLQHKEVFRPWGKHDTIAEGARYHVKAVTVKPGEKTATQLHYHRAEHWVVVSGTAKVTKGADIMLLTENESIYIPVGMPHSVENPGFIPLELIEVRTGVYLNENDVIRLEEYGAGY